MGGTLTIVNEVLFAAVAAPENAFGRKNMELSEYPTFTVIMRGYTPDQADAIMQAMAGFEDQFGVEVTMNTPHALDIIENGNAQYGDKLKIGAGTVLTLDEAKDAIGKGAKFILSPIEFTDDIFAYAKAHKVITVPAAMSPTEVHTMFDKGADIVKIFPAITVGSGFSRPFKHHWENCRLWRSAASRLKT